jgi:heme-degrading monooxygenase HmoA
MGSLAENLTPPYYEAVLNETQGGLKDKDHVAPTDEMVTLATRQMGFLGLETAQAKKGPQITVSHCQDVDAIEKWINAGDHKINDRFGIGLADTCGIEINLIDEFSHPQKGKAAHSHSGRSKETGKDSGVLRGLNAYVAAAVSSLTGLLP